MTPRRPPLARVKAASIRQPAPAKPRVRAVELRFRRLLHQVVTGAAVRRFPGQDLAQDRAEPEHVAAPIEVLDVSERLLGRHVGRGAEHRADHYDQETNKKEIYSGSLKSGFPSRHRRRDKQAGGQPCRGNPEDRQLRVPCPGDRVGQKIRQRNSVET